MIGIGISAITYAARNNLQAVLDEYVHCLLESEGLIDAEPCSTRYRTSSCAIGRAISLLPSQIEVDNPRVRSGRLSYRQVHHAGLDSPCGSPTIATKRDRRHA